MRVIKAQIVVLNLPAVGLPERCESETVDRHTKTPKDDRNQLYHDYMRSLSEDQRALNARLFLRMHSQGSTENLRV